jgi:hypothetical protein
MRTLSSKEKKRTLELFQAHLTDVMFYAEILISDQFSEEERREMRNQFGRKEFFHVSLLLDGLGSKSSRESILKDFAKRKDQ